MTDNHWYLLLTALAVSVLIAAVTGHVAVAVACTFAMFVVGLWRQRA